MTEAKPEVLYSEACLDRRVRDLADAISLDFEGKDLLVVGILNGAFVFMADLIRRLRIPCRVDFVRLASYGGCESSGKIRITKDLEEPVAGRHLLIVEDIVDTGLTLTRLVASLRRRQPASLKVCVLLDKPERRRVPFAADYVGFSIPDRFVVGYGLDYNERYRNIPDVCVLRELP